MAEYRASSDRARHRMVLLMAIALHILAIYFWPSARRRPGEPDTGRPAMFMRLLSPARSAHDELPAPPTVRRPTAADRITQAIRAPAAATPDPETNTASTTVAPAAAGIDDLMSNARRDVGKIDRDLRAAYPKLPQAAPVSLQSRLEKGIAAAARPQAGTVQEKVFSDGRRVTRIIRPGGVSSCVTSGSVGATDGLDRIQSKPSAYVSNCDHLFD